MIKWMHYTKSHSVAVQLVTQLQAEQESSNMSAKNNFYTYIFSKTGIASKGPQRK